jgi:hypothetical protein
MISQDNYEEYMMLLADGELNATDTAELYAFVKGNQVLEAELKAYLNTKITGDSAVEMPGKETLLRKEDKKTFVFSRPSTYYAAAAALILLLITSISIFNFRHAPINVATNSSSQPALTDLYKNTTKPAETAPINTPPNADNEKAQVPYAHVSHTNVHKALLKNTKDKNSTLHKTEEENVIAKAIAMQDEELIRNRGDYYEHVEDMPGYKMHQIDSTSLSSRKETKQTNDQGLPVIHQDIVKIDAISGKEITDSAALTIINIDKPNGRNDGRNLARLKNKVAKLNVLQGALSGRLKRVKKLQQNINDTQIVFKLGNKELLAFNF